MNHVNVLASLILIVETITVRNCTSVLSYLKQKKMKLFLEKLKIVKIKKLFIAIV